MASSHVYVLPDQSPYEGGKIYDRYGNLEYFADVSALSDVVATGGFDSVQAVKAHTRSPYLNSKARISVPAHDRNVVLGVKSTKGALPGRTFTLKTSLEKRDFTTTASMSALYTWLKTTAKFDVVLISDNGSPYEQISAVASGNGGA